MKKFEPKYITGMTFLTVSNLERAKKFYEEVLKLKLVMDQGVCLVYRVCKGSYLGFCEKLSVIEQSEEPSKVIFTFVVDSKEEVDAIYEQLKEKKEEVILDEPKDLNVCQYRELVINKAKEIWANGKIPICSPVVILRA